MALVGNDLPLGTKINAISGNTLTLSAPAVGSSSISLTAFQPGSLGGSTAAPSNLVINGGTLKYLGSGITTDRLFTMGSSGATLDASGAGRISFTNPNDLAFLNPNEASTLTLSGTNSGLNTLAAMIGDNGTGATTVAKSGSGTWVLAGTCNTFSGGIDLLGGQLQLASYGALPAGAVIKFAGGALQYNTSNISPNMLFRDHFSSEAGQAYAIDTNGLAITFDSPLTGGQHIPQNGSRHADVQRGQYLHG
jgi:fibronectin-binding autotransporter adhesin